jgi:hypothetical protein
MVNIVTKRYKTRSIPCQLRKKGMAVKQIGRKSGLPTDKFSLFETALVGRGDQIFML